MDAENLNYKSSSLTLGTRGMLEAEVDLSAIAENVRAVRAAIGPECGVIAVVKANGYGLGAQWVGASALAGGASMLAVARVDEGIALRLAGYVGPLLVMSYTSPDDALLAVRNNLTTTVHRESTVRALQDAALRLGLEPRSVRVHIKVDTGLGRYGCTPGEFLPLAHELQNCDRLHLEALMTHFAHADALDLSFMSEQLAIFADVRSSARAHGITYDFAHAANSAAAMRVPEVRFDMVRVGILLSGHSPTPGIPLPVELRRAITLRSMLMRVFAVQAGDTVGYGRTWVARDNRRVGLVSIGYGDGYSRALSNKGEMLVRGVRCPVIGRVSMDQTTVDVTAVPGAAEGDEVIVIGAQGNEEITTQDLADQTGTISYEVLCGLAQRVPRLYIRDGQPVDPGHFDFDTHARASAKPDWNLNV